MKRKKRCGQWIRNILFSFFAAVGSLGIIPCLAFSSPESGPKSSFSVYRGVCHVHTNFSHDSEATLVFVIQQASELNLDFVIVTDHNSLKGVEAYQKMKHPERPLLIFGDEISTSDGHLIALGIHEEPPKGISSKELVNWIHARGGYAILAHPFSKGHPWKNFEIEGWDGFEIYNFGHKLFEENAVDFYLRSFSKNEKSLLESVQNIPGEHFSFWAQHLRKRPIAALGGTDAHLKRSKKVFSSALQSVTMYVLTKALDEKEIVEAVGSGRSFVVFETLGEAREFSFEARAHGEIFYQGDRFQTRGDVSFRVHVPVPATVRLVRDDAVVSQQETTNLRFLASEPGAYRVQVYREGRFWIISNPIILERTERNRS
jgi:hypothetical protein